ncbi:uncharacterized protein K02A2.6-like [Cephus cinctus]|uniref:Uncharacterized protein K02A2.6-like n=1 Tax=Cephus cinctus TaxID=211228 RepID=A0AAJ7CE41_CEPCN|nr:uncharacterized protein K02A2.6-like [Cephus cinctus]
MGPYPRTSHGKRFLLVVIDLFTRWVEAFLLGNSEAPTLICTLEKEVFSRWGYPQHLLSDNGPQFTSQIWKEAAQKWEIQLWTTPIYHPQANPTERRNQEIKKGLRLRLEQSRHRTWDRYIPEILFNLRRRQNAATGRTPAEVLLGKNLQRPGDWRLRNTHDHKEEDRQPYQQEAQVQQQRYQKRYKGEIKPPTYQPGDWVYLREHPLSNAAEGFNAGFAPRQSGPYQILTHLSGGTFTIAKRGQAIKVHEKLLRPDHHEPVGVDHEAEKPVEESSKVEEILMNRTHDANHGRSEGSSAREEDNAIHRYC